MKPHFSNSTNTQINLKVYNGYKQPLVLGFDSI